LYIEGEPETAEPEVRVRRQWELWSVEDKNVFFEALNEVSSFCFLHQFTLHLFYVLQHGKDFDAIHAALLTRHKKKGGEGDVKSKNQVRHFYYRTCQKIFKVTNLSQFEQEEGILLCQHEFYLGKLFFFFRCKSSSAGIVWLDQLRRIAEEN
jgi:hypothetical protein